MIKVKDYADLKNYVQDPQTVLADLDVSAVDCLDYLFLPDPFAKAEIRTDFSGIENWDVANVQSAVGTFAYCRGLDKVDFSSWDLRNCRNTSMMFYGCKDLNGNFSSWKLPNCENITRMFSETPLQGDLGLDERLPAICRNSNFAVIEKSRLSVLGEIDAQFIPKQAIQKVGNELIAEFKAHKENFKDSRINLHIYPDLASVEKKYEYHVLEFSRNRICLSNTPLPLLELRCEAEHFKIFDNFGDYLKRKKHQNQFDLKLSR